MLIIAPAMAIGLALTYVVMRRFRVEDPAQLSEPRTAIPTMGVQIVCGDCAGDEFRPLKTYLDRHGKCERCGGHSYLLAANLAINVVRARFPHPAGYETVPGNGRVIPFEAPLGSRNTRTDKIAV